ncbi:putative ATP-dependent RNA helicase TDRD12 [Engraulis encrasicolus]|uniref:putative ATP-dependent RNA helicase TDRD12 n=1 Tax=Engraulis encrasicolus TaxID=184585 RepID=UPI002FD3E7D9
MLELSILKIEDPSCMWGRIMKGPGFQAASQEEYEHLKVEMNLFYHDLNLDLQTIRPSSLKKGELCALFSPLLTCWCRAVVASVYKGDNGSRVTCSLVDYVEDVNTTDEGVFVLMEKFLTLPFRVRKFHLADIYPLSLQVSFTDAKAQLVPSHHWDSSATRYLYILWQASSQVEAVVCGSKDDVLEIELYLTINGTKYCVNHDLLAKRLACSKTERERLQREGGGLPPVFLKGDLFDSPEKFLAMNGFGVKPTHLNGLTYSHSDVHLIPAMLPAAHVVNDGLFRRAQGAVRRRTQPPVSCIGLPPPPDVSTEDESSESECSEERGPTLADECMAELQMFRFLRFMNPDAVGECLAKADQGYVSDGGDVPSQFLAEVAQGQWKEVAEQEIRMTEQERAPPPPPPPPPCPDVMPPQDGAPPPPSLLPHLEMPPQHITAAPLAPAQMPSQMAPPPPSLLTVIETTAAPLRLAEIPSQMTPSQMTYPPSLLTTEMPSQKITAAPVRLAEIPSQMALPPPLLTTEMPSPERVSPSPPLPQLETPPQERASPSPLPQLEMPPLEIPFHELNSPLPLPPAAAHTDVAPLSADDSGGPRVRDWSMGELKHKKPRTEDERMASRLMEYLNPGPLNVKEEADDDVLVVPVVPKRDGVLLHSSAAVDAWHSLAQSSLSKYFKRYLKGRKEPVIDVGLRYCWPPVLRGSNTLIVAHAAQDPLVYLPPLITLMQNTSDLSSRARHSTLSGVILCPGWEKANSVLDLLETSHTANDLKPTMVLLGQKEEEIRAFKLQNNCRLLVTTPFTLLRLLEAHCSLFLHLSHLVLDEVDKLYTRAPQQMEEVLRHFRDVVSSPPGSQTPKQLVAVGSSWSAGMEGLLTGYMWDPSVIITVPQEAALYGGVHQMIHLCLDCEKVPVMLRALDFSPSVPHKTLIITSSIQELDQVYEAVANSSALALKVHEGLTQHFDLVMEHWKKAIGAGTHVILVTTEKCLKALGIDDATSVVHYGFPMTPKLFGSRLFCMSANFRVVSEYRLENERGGARVANSILLLTDKNSRQVSGVLRYLRRTGALLPPELLSFAQGVQQFKEEQKAQRPLCPYLKSLGFCKDTRECPDRHILDRSQDEPKLALQTGLVEVLPLYIHSASVFYGRLVSKDDTGFDELAAKMAAHFGAEHRWATEVTVGELYAMQDEEEYHRVRVVSVPEKGDCLFSCATVHFIDEGSTRTVKSHQLLQLPPDFHSLPPQAVEIVLCGAKPIDNEVDWDPKATRAISQTIRGKRHQAKVLMCLGSTLWVSSMVSRIRAPLLKTFINEYDVCNEVLSTGLGVPNSEAEHLTRLQTALEGPLGVIDHSTVLRSENVTVDEELPKNSPVPPSTHEVLAQGVSGEMLPSPGLQTPVELPMNNTPPSHISTHDGYQAVMAQGVNGEILPSPGLQTPVELPTNNAPPSHNTHVGYQAVNGEMLPSPPGLLQTPVELPMNNTPPSHSSHDGYQAVNGEILHSPALHIPAEAPSPHVGYQAVNGDILNHSPGLHIPAEAHSSTELPPADGDALSLRAMQAACLAGGLAAAPSSGQIDMAPLRQEEIDGYLPQSCLSSVGAPCVIDGPVAIPTAMEPTAIVEPVAIPTAIAEPVASPTTMAEPVASATAIAEPVTSPNVTAMTALGFSSSSRQPQVRWFQRQDVVILRVKLTSPVMQTCHFFSDGVVYSGYVNGVHYYSALELTNAVRAERCTWTMKCNEPEMTLVKSQPGEWRTLLKTKNGLVSYDYDHMEDEDINLVNEHHFVGNVAEDGLCYEYASSDGSESD